MFEEPPIYYILISLIFLIVFGAISFAKLVVTSIGFLLAAMTVILYTISAE